MPFTIQTGRATAAVPPAATFCKGALRSNDVIKYARGAAVVVAVDGAEAKAVLVVARISPQDGIAFVDRENAFEKFSTYKTKTPFFHIQASNIIWNYVICCGVLNTLEYC